MIRTAFLVTVAVVIAAPAVAGSSTDQSQTAAKPANPQDKVICRFINTTGSRLSRERACKTRAEWNRESDEAGDDIERQRDRATGDATNGPH